MPLKYTLGKDGNLCKFFVKLNGFVIVLVLLVCFNHCYYSSNSVDFIVLAESVREHLSSLNMRPKEDVEDGDDSLPPPPPMEDENEEHTIEEESKQEEPQSEVSKEQLPEPSSLLEASSSRDKSVAPSCLPVPQSVLDQDKPAPESMVQDYATGYETPIQKTAPPQEPWVPQPIPLPRGVLEADKIWTKKDQGEAAPSPQPRSSTSAGDNSVVAQTARTGNEVCALKFYLMGKFSFLFRFSIVKVFCVGLCPP